MGKEKTLYKKHQWMPVACVTTELKMRPEYDKWEWCKKCGILNCNQAEFFVQGSQGLYLSNPKGVAKDPGCLPVSWVRQESKEQEELKKSILVLSAKVKEYQKLLAERDSRIEEISNKLNQRQYAEEEARRQTSERMLLELLVGAANAENTFWQNKCMDLLTEYFRTGKISFETIHKVRL